VVIHARLAATSGISPDQADLLSAEAATAAWFDAAVAAGSTPGPTARWLLNELLGLAGDVPLPALPLQPGDFGRFVSLAESGRTTGAGAKALLASLVERPGDPAARLAELGLEKLDDRAAVDGAVARVLSARAAEVARYRAGETKLLAFLLGAVMRETQGKSDPATVRKALQEALG
jgi:Asp-tRNA(Asn)/Glu-tRNA(Gln) amidotransferase B subunit